MGWSIVATELTEARTRTRARRIAAGGFTLLEVLITMAVLAVGILGVSGLAVHTINGRDRSLELTEGTVLAQDRLEVVRAGGYWNLAGMIATENYGDIPKYPNYWRKTVVQDNFPDTGMALVTVKVRWTGASSNRLITSQVRTIISRPPGIPPAGYVPIP